MTMSGEKRGLIYARRKQNVVQASRASIPPSAMWDIGGVVENMIQVRDGWTE